MDLLHVIESIVKMGATDLHLSAGCKPTIRVNGDFRLLTDAETVSESELQKFVKHTVPENLQAQLNTVRGLDFAFQLAHTSRFRVNVYKALNGINVALRILPIIVPTLDELHVPSILKTLCQRKQGLVLVTGPTGSGKSTTLAAMINEINQTSHKHIITLEDPIEYLFINQQSLIHQRQIGMHTESFSQGLREALREDPDILLVGEIRDLETMRLALTAAETGHLVFASLHTSSAAKTIHRIIDIFPAEEKAFIGTLLADSLEAVIAQTLVKKKEGGLMSVYEIMIANTAVRNLIRDNKAAQLYSVMQTGQQYGMCTMEQALAELGQEKKSQANRIDGDG